MSKISKVAVSALCVLAITILAAPPAFAGSNSLMITQFYAMGGAGGSAPSTYVENYVELYNNGYSDINFNTSDWTIQFQIPTGAMATNTSYYLGGHGVTYGNGFNGILRPGQYMLITATAGTSQGAGHVPLTADLVITPTTPTVAGTGAAIATLYAATNGLVAVTNSANPVLCTGTTPNGAVDFVGYGTASCYEGAGAVVMSSGSATKVRAMWRGPQSPNSGTGNTGLNLCTGDTDNNNPDFQYVEIQTKSTYNQDQSWTLHNSTNVWAYNGTAFASSAYTAIPTPACGTAFATPAHVLPGETAAFSVSVTPTQISVAPFSGQVDLSQIGLSSTEPLVDDGSGTNTLVTAELTVPANQALGTFKIPFTVHDSATTPTAVTVLKLPFLVGTPASATLTVNSTTAAYGKSKTFVNTITPGPCTVTKQPIYTVYDADNNVVTFPWPVGTNSVVASGALSPDCNFTYVAGTFTVTPGTQSAKISCPNVSQGIASTTYTGSPIACPVTASYGTCDPATFIGINGTIYGPTTTPPTGIGSYDVEELGACVSTSPNYGDPTLPSGVTLNISQGAPNVKISCATVTYNGSPQPCAPGVSASVDKAGTIPIAGGSFSPLTYTGVTDPTYGPTTNPPTQAGDYSVWSTYTPSDPGWASASGSGTFTISLTQNPPIMTSPASGSVLPGSTVTFTWQPAAGAQDYFIWIGSTLGAMDIYNGDQGLNTSATINGLPGNGSAVYVRLFVMINSAWQWNDYAYTAASASKAEMLTPAPSATLPGASATFTWSSGAAADQYWIWVGTTQGGMQIYNQGQGKNLSAVIGGLPIDGSTVYVRLFTWVSGGWQWSDYTYTASTTSKAAIVTPANGSTLTGSSATFTWSAGVGAAMHHLWVGTTPGGMQLYNQGQGLGTSATVNGLPTNGTTIYVRLLTWVNGGWQYNDYTYTVANPTKAEMISPANGSTLPGSTVTFNWTPGVAAVSYYLWVGSMPASASDTDPGRFNYVHQDMGLTTSLTATTLPTDGSTVYARLFTWVNGGWQWNDYSYTASH